MGRAPARRARAPTAEQGLDRRGGVPLDAAVEVDQASLEAVALGAPDVLLDQPPRAGGQRPAAVGIGGEGGDARQREGRHGLRASLISVWPSRIRTSTVPAVVRRTLL